MNEISSWMESGDSMGAYIDDVYRSAKLHPLLTAEQEKEYARLARNGSQEYRHKLAQSNLRLVISIARHYTGRGVSIADIVAEGNVGLMKAVDRFNPDAGCRFSTYAIWWIKQSIRREIPELSRIVHIPSNMLSIVSKYKTECERLEQNYKRRPTEDEIFAVLKLRGSKYKRIREGIINAVRLEMIDNFDIFTDEEFSPLGIFDSKTDDEFRTLSSAQEVARIFKIYETDDSLKTKSARRREVIQVMRLKYGINKSKTPLTLREVGERINLSRERVRQIEKEFLDYAFKTVIQDSNVG